MVCLSNNIAKNSSTLTIKTVDDVVLVSLFIYLFIYLIRYLKSMLTIVKKLIYIDNKKALIK